MSTIRRCRYCGQAIKKADGKFDASVYFGVVGPFCDVACRELWLERPHNRGRTP